MSQFMLWSFLFAMVFELFCSSLPGRDKCKENSVLLQFWLDLPLYVGQNSSDQISFLAVATSEGPSTQDATQHATRDGICLSNNKGVHTACDAQCNVICME